MERKLKKVKILEKMKHSKATVPVIMITGLLLFLSLVVGLGLSAGKKEMVNSTKAISDSQKNERKEEMDQVMSYLATLDETVTNNQNALATMADHTTLYQNKSEQMKNSTGDIKKLIENYLKQPGVEKEAEEICKQMLVILEEIYQDVATSEETFVSLLEEYKTAEESRRLEIEKELQILPKELNKKSEKLLASFQKLQVYIKNIADKDRSKELSSQLDSIGSSLERYLLEEMTSFTNLLSSTSLNIATKLEQKITSLKEEMSRLGHSIHTTQSDILNLSANMEEKEGQKSEVINQEFTLVKNSIETLNEEFEGAHHKVKEMMEELSKEMDKYYEEQKKALEKYFTDQKKDMEMYWKEEGQETDIKFEEQAKLLEESFLKQEENHQEQIKLLEENFSKQEEERKNRATDQERMLEEKFTKQEEVIAQSFLEQTTYFDEVYGQLQKILETMSSEMETLLTEQFTQMHTALTQMEDTYLATMEDYHKKTIWNLSTMNESMVEQHAQLSSSITQQHEQLNTAISNQYQTIATTITDHSQGQRESFDNLMGYLEQKLNQVFTSVSNGKKKVVSALLTKGVALDQDATFLEIYEAILAIDQELVIGVEKIPGEITYEYHYHRDGKGNQLHAETCPTSQKGGCYTQPTYHYHEDHQATAQAASYLAPQQGGCFTQKEFHVHAGASTAKGGCYTIPVYHTHSGNSSQVGGCYGNIPYTVSQSCGCSSYSYTELPGYEGHPTCANCYHNHGSGRCGAVTSSYVEYRIGLTCGKTTDTIERYELSCGMTQDSIIGYSLGCGKTTSTLEAYQPACGFSDGQITGAHILYDQNQGTRATVMSTRPPRQDSPLPEQLKTGEEENKERIEEELIEGEKVEEEKKEEENTTIPETEEERLEDPLQKKEEILEESTIPIESGEEEIMPEEKREEPKEEEPSFLEEPITEEALQENSGEVSKTVAVEEKEGEKGGV